MNFRASLSEGNSVALFLPSLEGGGAERVFVDLANEFADLGLRVDLVLARAYGPYIDEVSAAVRVVNLRASRVLHSLPKLIRYLRSERPDVLLSGLEHSNLVALSARLAAGVGTRCVISARSVPTAVYRGARSVRSGAVLQLARVAYRFADAIIANSKAVLEDLAQGLKVPRAKLHLVYNPLNLPQLQRLSEQLVDHPWCARGFAPIILGVGSLTALKDFPTLIRAFATIRSRRDSRLVILGEGPERPALEALIRRLQLEQDVYLPGFVRNPFSWMRRAGVLVSSSLTEGCPNALMQALACGTPVIGTDCVGGSGEILEGGKWGQVVTVGDADALADAVLEVFNSKARIDTKQRANDFALRRVAQQYLQVLLPSRNPSALGR
jgi:glycosyltransferase involved in cell wall biosynthesis